MALSASTIKELREKSGAGMMDCKKALVESNGNMEMQSIGLENKAYLLLQKNLIELQLKA